MGYRVVKRFIQQAANPNFKQYTSVEQFKTELVNEYYMDNTQFIEYLEQESGITLDSDVKTRIISAMDNTTYNLIDASTLEFTRVFDFVSDWEQFEHMKTFVDFNSPEFPPEWGRNMPNYVNLVLVSSTEI